MSQSIPTAPSLQQTANVSLAKQIVAAFLEAEFIAASDEDEVFRLLTTGNVKSGDWHRLLEKNLPDPVTRNNSENATTHHAA